jgi:hypothetical protein
MSRFINQSGKVFGNLKVISKNGVNKKGETLWNCKCKCGNDVIVRTYMLNNGTKTDCGTCPLVKTRITPINVKFKEISYIRKNDYIIGIDKRGNQFLFDLDDFERLKEYNWHLDANQYVRCKHKGNYFFMHRFLLHPKDGEKVDHINGNTFDNRKINLRIVNSSQNGMNCSISSNNTSGHTGVHFHKKTKLWRANIYVDGKLIYLGNYKEIGDAIKARKMAEEKYFREYSRNNRTEVPNAAMLKEYSISGILSIPNSDISHEDLIRKLFEELKNEGIYFRGETKEVKKREQLNT